MALRPRRDAPPVVLLGAALLVAIPALLLSVDDPVGAAVGAGVVVFAAGLLSWRMRLASRDSRVRPWTPPR